MFPEQAGLPGAPAGTTVQEPSDVAPRAAEQTSQGLEQEDVQHTPSTQK
jgi:hypothetical protein